MFITFGEITQLFIKAALAKNNTSLLSLIIFMRQDQIILRNLS